MVVSVGAVTQLAVAVAAPAVDLIGFGTGAGVIFGSFQLGNAAKVAHRLAALSIARRRLPGLSVLISAPAGDGSGGRYQAAMVMTQSNVRGTAAKAPRREVGSALS